MTLSFKPFIQPNNILMSCSLQNFILLFNLPQTSLISHKLFGNRLQRHKLARKPIDCQINLAKSSFANNFSNLIAINGCSEFLATLDPLNQSLSSRRQILLLLINIHITKTLRVLNSFGLLDFWLLNMLGLVEDNLWLLNVSAIWGCVSETHWSYLVYAFTWTKYHILLVLLKLVWLLV